LIAGATALIAALSNEIARAHSWVSAEKKNPAPVNQGSQAIEPINRFSYGKSV
jgi:hypothetical protein